jgi:hypothetical protein
MPVLRASLIAAVAALALACAGPAAARPYVPPGHGVFHAGIGGYGAGAPAAFARQSGKHPAIYQYFIQWRAQPRDVNFYAGLMRTAAAAGSRSMFHVSTAGTGLTPRSIAQGKGDVFLVAMNWLAAIDGHPVYLRLLSEMNNGSNPYSAYTLSGRSRGRAYTTRQFKRAWRRAVLVIRGGSLATIDRKLARLHMPPVRTAAAALPRPQVAFLWVPLSFGNPEIPRNHPKHWWPGSKYVDWVGTTWYSPYLAVKAMDRFYRYPLWRHKPFAFGEYGVWGAESTKFIRLFFRFVRTHRRVRLISYYQSANLKPAFRLSTHPRSRAALRRQLRSRRYVAFAPEFRR